MPITEERYTKFNDPVDSFRLGQRFLGFVEPGRYKGFDTLLTTPSSLNFSISQAGDNYQITDLAGAAQGPFGVIMTQQGIAMQMLGEADLVAASNGGNSKVRNDLIILEHTYTQVVGGQISIISIVTGPFEDPSLPAVPNPDKQIILGTLTIGAAENDLDTATYTPQPVPADLFLAYVNRTQQFIKTQGWSRNSGKLTQSGTELVFSSTADDANWFTISDVVTGTVNTFNEDNVTLPNQFLFAVEYIGGGSFTMADSGIQLPLNASITVTSGDILLIWKRDTSFYKVICTSKTIEDIATLFTDLTDLTNDLTVHEADTAIHYLENTIDHFNILNVGTNSHGNIDNHITGLQSPWASISLGFLTFFQNTQADGLGTDNALDLDPTGGYFIYKIIGNTVWYQIKLEGLIVASATVALSVVIDGAVWTSARSYVASYDSDNLDVAGIISGIQPLIQLAGSSRIVFAAKGMNSRELDFSTRYDWQGTIDVDLVLISQLNSTYDFTASGMLEIQ